MSLMNRAAQYAYWTGRLSASLDAVLDSPLPSDREVARSCLNEFVEWRDGLQEEAKASASSFTKMDDPYKPRPS